MNEKIKLEDLKSALSLEIFLHIPDFIKKVEGLILKL